MSTNMELIFGKNTNNYKTIKGRTNQEDDLWQFILTERSFTHFPNFKSCF